MSYPIPTLQNFEDVLSFMRQGMAVIQTEGKEGDDLFEARFCVLQLFKNAAEFRDRYPKLKFIFWSYGHDRPEYFDNFILHRFDKAHNSNWAEFAMGIHASILVAHKEFFAVSTEEADRLLKESYGKKHPDFWADYQHSTDPDKENILACMMQNSVSGSSVEEVKQKLLDAIQEEEAEEAD